MIKQLTYFLGPARLQALMLLFGATGLASLVLTGVAGDAAWLRPVQSGLLLVFAIGAAVIVGGRMEREERGRWLAMGVPALGAVILGLTVLPQYALALTGGAFGWIIAGAFLFRARTPMEYQRAIKALRKNDYAESVRAMDELIKEQPNDAQHYRFRAEVLRLWGKLDRARRDYQQMTTLEPDLAVGYNGLAEVYLQERNYEAALKAANRAYTLAPNEWVAAYNLGMIEDRLAHAPEAIEHLNRALTLNVPDARHRLLIHLYLARAYSRAGDMAAAQAQVGLVKKHRSGLQEWETILESDQAATLRAVLGDDVNAAAALANGTLDAAALGRAR